MSYEGYVSGPGNLSWWNEKKKIKNLNQNQKLLKNSEFNEIYREYIK